MPASPGLLLVNIKKQTNNNKTTSLWNYFSPPTQNNLGKRLVWGFLFVFGKSLIYGLIEDIKVLRIQSTAIWCFGWSVWRKCSPTRIHCWKKEEYFSTVFSDNYGYSSLILHQNLSGSFLKIWCKKKKKKFGAMWNLKAYQWPFEWIVYPCMTV